MEHLDHFDPCGAVIEDSGDAPHRSGLKDDRRSNPSGHRGFSLRARACKSSSPLEVMVSVSAQHSRLLGSCLALLLISTATGASAQEQIPGVQGPGDQEPITAVPLPPVANPKKLALGDRLFADPRLSRD